MIRDLYIPSDLSPGTPPEVPQAEMLRVIAQSPVMLERAAFDAHGNETGFFVSLPYTNKSFFSFFENELFTDFISVGHELLVRKGIGSRMLKAAVRHSVEQNDEIDTFTTRMARFGLVNLAAKVFGEANVSITKGDERFGRFGRLPLDAVLDVYPPVIGKKYSVDTLTARIDRQQAKQWPAGEVY